MCGVVRVKKAEVVEDGVIVVVEVVEALEMEKLPPRVDDDDDHRVGIAWEAVSLDMVGGGGRGILEDTDSLAHHLFSLSRFPHRPRPRPRLGGGIKKVASTGMLRRPFQPRSS